MTSTKASIKPSDRMMAWKRKKVKPFDGELSDSKSIDVSFSVSCHRELHRLERIVKCYRIAASLAVADGDGEAFATHIFRLHDHKGELTVTFFTRDGAEAFGVFFDYAWAQCFECHVKIKWIEEDGEIAASTDPDTLISALAHRAFDREPA